MEVLSTVKNFQEPLYFFEQLAPYINRFESIISVLSYGYIFSEVKNVDYENKMIRLEHPIKDILGNFVDTEEYDLPLELYSEHHIDAHVMWSLDTIKEYAHGVKEDVLKPYIQIQYNSIVLLIKQYNESIKEVEKYPVFGESLLRIEGEIKNRYLNFLDQQPAFETSVRRKNLNTNNQAKITWLQGPTCLASFIYSLSQLETKSGSKNFMLQADRKQLVNLIINNFTDNGKEFSPATLETYLDPKKKKKKTKFIELKFIE